MLLTDLLALYAKYHVLRPATEVHYAKVVCTFKRFLRRDPLITEVTIDECVDFRCDVLSRCSPQTFNNYRRHLGALFNFAVKRKFLSASPFADVAPAPTPRRKPKTVPIPFIQEVMAYLDGDEADDANEDVHNPLAPRWFWRIALRTLYYTGMRRRQLVELRLKDINFEEKMITLRAEGSKTKREWEIPLPDPLAVDLTYLHGRVLRRTGRKHGDQQLFCYPLFAKRAAHFKTQEMNEEHVSKWFQRLSRHFDRPVSAHRIRHTTATELARKTENMRLVQEILGHTDMRTTNIYVDPGMPMLRDLMARMTSVMDDR